MTEQIKSHLTSDDVFANPDFPLTVLRREPQIPFPKHTHDFAELVIVYGGRGIHFTEEENYTVGSGEVFILTGDRAHGYRNPEDLKLINIIFDQKILQIPSFSSSDLDSISGFHALFKWEPRLRTAHKFESRLRLKPVDLAKTLKFAEKLEDELNNAEPGFRAMSYSLFMQLCVFLSRRYESGTSQGMKELSRISGALNYLENNLLEHVKIEELTNIAGMSESTLLRLFNKTTGTGPVEYHNRLRISKVCELLTKTDKTITEIAYDTGFSDSNYLSRIFKKIIGIPPAEWRKNQSEF